MFVRNLAAHAVRVQRSHVEILSRRVALRCFLGSSRLEKLQTLENSTTKIRDYVAYRKEEILFPYSQRLKANRSVHIYGIILSSSCNPTTTLPRVSVNITWLTGLNKHVYIECSDSVSGSHVVGQVYMYCIRKIIVCGLPDADRKRYIDKFKSLSIHKFPFEIPRTSLAPQNGVDNMTIESY